MEEALKLLEGARERIAKVATDCDYPYSDDLANALADVTEAIDRLRASDPVNLEYIDRHE